MIKINISNKVAYTIIFILILALAGVIVYAYTNPIPDKGHGGDKILIAVPFVSEKTLQAAITDGNFFAAREGKPRITQYSTTGDIGPHDLCFIQSFKQIDWDHNSYCFISQNANGRWAITTAYASCTAICFDWMT